MPINRIFLSLLIAAFTIAPGSPSDRHLVAPGIFSAIAAEYSGEFAQENTRHIAEYHRIQGSPMMAEVAERVILARLRAMGIEAKIEQFPSDGRTKYHTYTSPMGWEIRDGELWLEGVAGDPLFKPIRLCSYRSVPMCVSTYSKGGTWSGELVDVGKGLSEADYVAKDVRGKVVLASGYAGSVMREAVIKRGAVGIVIYPDPHDRPGHPDMVLYNGIWPREDELEKTSGGFQISTNQYSQLKSLMQRGPARVRGTIDATLGPGQLTIVHGYIRGTEMPRKKEVLITAHLDHPKWSANDNASGSGTLIEMARTIRTLIEKKKIMPPRATIHFMWVPEYYGTVAYVAQHPELCPCHDLFDPPMSSIQANAPCILANINLDMVGEDTVKTGSRFYMTRNPDSVPSSLEALLEDLLEQTKEANLYAPAGTRNYWPAEMSPYAQGSDHDIFVGLGIPSSMFGHEPEWTHHTSEDTMDKTDASELLRIGVLATAAAVWMTGEPQWFNLKLLSTGARLSEYARRAAKIAAHPAFPPRAAEMLRLQYCRNAMIALAQNHKEMVDGVLSTKVEKLRDGSVRVSSTLGSKEYPQMSPCPLWICDGRPGNGPRRLAQIPFDSSALQNLAGEDKSWWNEQAARFSGQPDLSLIVFEAMNFMNGQRTAEQIAVALSAEFNLDLDQLWLKRLIQILAAQKLVAPK